MIKSIAKTIMATLGVEVEKSDVALKHLGFVRMLAINVVVVVLKLYGYAKQKLGPLKFPVEMGERIVAAVVGPIYYKFKEVPNDILVFLDHKVDEVFNIFDKYAPPIAKSVVSKALSIVKKSLGLVDSPVAATSHVGNISNEAFDKLVPPIAKGMVKKASDLVQEGPLAAISHADKISKEASSIFDERALPMAKGVVSKASDLVPEGPVGKISKKASNMFGLGSLPITKGVGSLVKKTSDLVQEGPVAAISEASKISHIFDEAALPIAKDVGSMVKKTSDLVLEGPISEASKISKEVSHIFDEAALPIAKGVGSMVKKTSDLVQEGPAAAISHAAKISKEVSHIFDEGVGSMVKKGPLAAISYAGKISKEASHIFDEYAPPIAKSVVSMAGSMVKNASDLVHVARVSGPFAAISHFGKISTEFAVKQLVTLWYKANQYSFLIGILEIVIPVVAYLLKKYNSLVKHLKRKGWFSLFNYVPLVPVEEMELAYKTMEAAAAAAKKSREMAEKAAAAATRFNDIGS